MRTSDYIGGRGFGKQYRQIKSLLEVIKELEEENKALKTQVARSRQVSMRLLNPPPVAKVKGTGVMFQAFDEEETNVIFTSAFDELNRVKAERAACANAPGSCRCPFHKAFQQRINELPMPEPFEAEPYQVPYLQRRKHFCLMTDKLRATTNLNYCPCDKCKKEDDGR